MAGCSNYNTLAVRKASRSKRQAREMFERHDIPHAQGTLFLNPYKAHKFAKQHGFPLVIKPNVSGFSRGSHFPINNFKELWKAALMVKVWWPTSVVEQYLLGANYRVLATDNEMVSVIRRYPPFVNGNGSDTIDKLIDDENTIRAEMELHPTIYPISKSTDVVKFLKRKGLTLESIPAAGDHVELFNRVALAPGGIVEIIDQDSIPAVNRDMFFKVIKAFDAKLFGIDVIFEKGIDVPYTDQKCIFLEVNSRPYTRMHDFPRYGEKEDLSKFYKALDALVITDSDIF